MYSEYLNNLIISADRFGISKKANHSILELAKNKKIDRVSIMIGGDISPKEAKGLLESGAKLDIQLHLMEPDFFDAKKIFENKSFFKKTLLFLVDFTSGRFSPKKVKILWKKQIKEFKDIFGKYPDGINSFENLHFFPPFFRPVMELKRKFSISYLRFGKIQIRKFGWFSNLLDRLRHFNAKRNHILFAAPDYVQNIPIVLNTSDILVNFGWIKNTPEFFENLPDIGQTELVFDLEKEGEAKFLEENF